MQKLEGSLLIVGSDLLNFRRGGELLKSQPTKLIFTRFFLDKLEVGGTNI